MNPSHEKLRSVIEDLCLGEVFAESELDAIAEAAVADDGRLAAANAHVLRLTRCLREAGVEAGIIDGAPEEVPRQVVRMKAAFTAELDACRCPVAAAYERFKHLDKVFEMVGDTDGTENTDPFHAAARDLWRAVKASIGIPANEKVEAER